MKKIGPLLRQERLRRRLTLLEVEKAIKIKASLLELIEKGEYQKLPSRAHAQGFVISYAEFLGISKHQASALFRREFDEAREFRVLPKGLTPNSEFPLYKRKLPLTAIGIIAMVLVIIVYLLFQYRFAFINPPLSLTSPEENAQIHAQTVTVAGSTDANATLTINNDSVAISDDGTFKKDVIVFPGQSTIHLVVKSKFGKETVLDRHIRVVPSS